MPAELQDDDLSMDSDDLPSDLDDDSEEDKDEEDASAQSEDDAEEEKDDDDDKLSLVEGSDNEDLVSLDAAIPDGLIDFDGPASDGEEEWGGIEDGSKRKRKRGNDEDEKKRKKKLRSLPTFASYDDYAKMIEDGPEDNI